MNYIGSKLSLLPQISRVLDLSDVPPYGIALDIFAGTGVVSQLLKARGHTVYSNDWQYYSYLTCAALIECDSIPEFEKLLSDYEWGMRIREATSSTSLFPTCSYGSGKRFMSGSPATAVLSYLSRLAGEKGAFYEAYCEGGSGNRQYFSRENGMRIQAIRDQIEQWSKDKLILGAERAWLISGLLEGADKVANTASVYGAFLKHIKKSARKPLQLYAIDPVRSTDATAQHRAFCADAETLLRKLREIKLRLIYIDPPYNSRQYNANYHILETIARWDLENFTPRGVTGLRSADENVSEYCSKRHVENAFRRLFQLANAEFVLFSYNDEGLLPREGLEALFSDYCTDIAFYEIPYRRFRADSNGENRNYKRDSTHEFLVLGRLSATNDTQTESAYLHRTPALA